MGGGAFHSPCNKSRGKPTPPPPKRAMVSCLWHSAYARDTVSRGGCQASVPSGEHPTPAPHGLPSRTSLLLNKPLGGCVPFPGLIPHSLDVPWDRLSHSLLAFGSMSWGLLLGRPKLRRLICDLRVGLSGHQPQGPRASKHHHFSVRPVPSGDAAVTPEGLFVQHSTVRKARSHPTPWLLRATAA